MKGAAVVVLLLASLHLSASCDGESKVLICREVPSAFKPGFNVLFLTLSNVGRLNSTALHDDNLASVTRLSLQSAEVTGVAESAFSSLQNLQTVQLGRNLLAEVDPGWFGRPAVVRELSLPHNKIQFLNGSSLRGLTGLSKLDLSQNLIASIHPDAFDPVTNLTELDLSQNMLTRLPARLFGPLGSARIRLDGNPWDCSCEARGLVDFLQGARNRSLLQRETAVTCETPPELMGQVVWNVSVECPTSAPASTTPPGLTSAPAATPTSTATEPASHTPSRAATSVSSTPVGPPAQTSTGIFTTAAGGANTRHTSPPGAKTSSSSFKPTRSGPPTAAPTTATSDDPKHSDPPGVLPTSIAEISVPSRLPSDSNLVRTLVAVIVVLSLLLLATCVLAALRRRKRGGKTAVVPRPQREEEEDVEAKEEPPHTQNDKGRDPEAAQARPFAGARAKSAGAVLLQAPFCSPGRDRVETESDINNSANDEEASQGSQEEDGARAGTGEEAGGGEGDARRDSACSGAAPYLSIGTNQSQSPAHQHGSDKEPAGGPSQRPRMGRISTWPPTAVQWRARRAAMQEGEEDGVGVTNWPPGEALKFLGGMTMMLENVEKRSDECGDTEAPTQTANELSETESDRPEQGEPPAGEARNHGDPTRGETPTEKDADAATKQTDELGNPNLKRKKAKPAETPASKTSRKSGGKGAPRYEQRAGGSGGKGRGGAGASASSKGPSGGASPDDETLLCGNEYAFMDLLHEVVQHNGRWTRDRWRQNHTGRQRNGQTGPR